MMCEQTGPKHPERDVALAGQAGFDFAVISDHYFLWRRHIVGGHRPLAGLRHEMLEEAVEIIRALWAGGAMTAA
jgi:alkanesulfonate monooxygenase SsuD/methylene tetrahydromethanopterin reductase-like flavin-dependent oxidoreductase (luciferase family)